MKPVLNLLLLVLAVLLSPVSAQAAERAIIVLDGSGSMWAQIDGKARITIARETLENVLSAVPDDLELGLMTYGHRSKGDCSDIELLVPPAAGTAAAIDAAAQAINPKGKTPLSDAVRLAAEDLRYTEDKATVILITDGLETCDADPCALGSELEKAGIDFTVDVVGFGLTEEEGKQVACLAENTGGQYLQATDEAALRDALTTSVAAVAQVQTPPAVEEPANPEFNFQPDVALYEGGPSLNGGNVWEVFHVNPDGSKGQNVTTGYGNDYKASLEPGDYIVRATLEHAWAEQPVTITAGEVAKPYFVLNGGTLKVHPKASEDEAPDASAAVEITFPNGESFTFYGDTTTVVPAGEQQIHVTLGNGEASDTVEVAAGNTVEKDIIIGVGHAVVTASYAEGTDVTDTSMAVAFYRGAKRIDGTREYVATGYGPSVEQDLPPGEYVAEVTVDQAVAEVPFTVEAGKRVEANAFLDAGVLAVSAPGATQVEFLAAKKNLNGDRKSFGVKYAEEAQSTLPAGDYAVVATLGNGKIVEGKATVKAGERTELTLE